MSFRDNINYVEEKCTKLIFIVSKSAKITWRLKHEALKNIHTVYRRNFTTFAIWSTSLEKCAEHVQLENQTN